MKNPLENNAKKISIIVRRILIGRWFNYAEFII